MPSWSDAEGGGAVHAALGGLLGKGDRPGDMLCFASAGNTAQRHWSGQVRPNADGFHQWQTSLIANELIPWSLEEISVELCSCTQAHYEVIVYDDTTHAVAALSNGHGGTGCC